MRYVFDHDYHIHSQVSSCSSDPEQNLQRLMQYAKDNGLKRVVLTDHHWDESVPGASEWYKSQDYRWISQSLPLPQEDGIEFLFGCECDMDKYLTLGMARENFERFSFVVIPTTHLHMTGFTITEEDAQSLERRAQLWVERLDALLNMDLPFEKIGIAHLACSLVARSSRQDYLEVMSMIPDEDMHRLFEKAARLGVGIELNFSDMGCSDEEADIVLRPFRIAKEHGCKFYMGSDAHHPASLERVKTVLEKTIDRLGLTEDDKFHIA